MYSPKILMVGHCIEPPTAQATARCAHQHWILHRFNLVAPLYGATVAEPFQEMATACAHLTGLCSIITCLAVGRSVDSGNDLDAIPCWWTTCSFSDWPIAGECVAASWLKWGSNIVFRTVITNLILSSSFAQLLLEICGCYWQLAEYNPRWPIVARWGNISDQQTRTVPSSMKETMF